MRTPVVMIIGMVLAPCGLVLNLTCTVAPNWRQLSQLTGKPQDVVEHQGIWDICDETVTNQNKVCGISNTEYFGLKVVMVARALMITSLVVTALGIVVASLGVRCWQDEPHFVLSGIGGLVIFISGVLSLIPVSWYNNGMYSLLSTDSSSITIQVDYALVLGYLGSCFEIIGGFSLALSFVRGCKDCIGSRRKSPTSTLYYKQNPRNHSGNPTSVYSIRTDRDNLGYSVGNDSYVQGNDRRYAPSEVSVPKSYSNPRDVIDKEHSRGPRRPASQLSSLPCDSDLL
ncbi:hypothetical protein XENTR_v10001094 [Xenopus tropicalis]|uniref:Claudin-23 n=1 Tax=Xenopus tropicalis TaxID=8364 RepID=A0A803KA29_XENTR|nr:claudin-23 [Xenopus tropicalis]KAE8631129.1 hypothetical protein XENTR_v10001094 [Xenopus tropicalis]|eukprot:XP_004911118.1 PREDICTED: claudin-23 [Xenopus tropicalis]